MITAPSGLFVSLPANPAVAHGASAAPASAPAGSASAAALPTASAHPGAALLGTMPLGAPVLPAPIPHATVTAGGLVLTAEQLGLATPAVSGGGGGALGAPMLPAAAPAPAPQPAAGSLTSLAPGALASDGQLVERTLTALRQSPAGAMLVDRLLAVGARINVISDAEFTAMGHARAHAFYDPATDAMFLRRSDLDDATNVGFAALALAHEGTHLLDDVGRVAEPFLQQADARIMAAGGAATAAGASMLAQSQWELSMIKEARAFTFAGQIARDLGVTTPPTDPTSTAAAGANDHATYERVWHHLLTTAYNAEGRSAAPRNF